MQYMGGKSRIASQIAGVIADITGGGAACEIPRREIEDRHTISRRYLRQGGECFVSLFCGSCAVESKVQGFSRMILNDRHEYLIALLRAVQRGYTLPDQVSPELYAYLRAHKDEAPALTGFVGFGCSFGGKWFGGYARNATGTNYAAQSKRSLLRDMATLMDAEFVCGDYRAVRIPPGAVIYADPPYNGTTGYGGAFDTTRFWAYMRLLADLGHPVFISEETGPDDIAVVWEKPFTRTLDRNKANQFRALEKLFYIPPRQGSN